MVCVCVCVCARVHMCMCAGPERRLVMVESKLIKCRMSQTIGGETTPFSFKGVEGVQRCTVFEVAAWADASYLCVGMPDKVLLLKYNPSLGMYCLRKVSHLFLFLCISDDNEKHYGNNNNDF